MTQSDEKTSKPISIRELKTFIEAVEFASDSDDWVPSARQWRKIRSLIDSLEETQALSSKDPNPVHRIMNGGVMPAEVVKASGAFSSPASNHVMLPPPMTPPAPFAVGTNGALRTPDIDTSNGNYTSNFA